MIHYRRGAALALALGVAACGGQPQQTAAPKLQLKVSLFAWIPDSDAFATWIETTFEAQHPDIDLVVRPMSAANNSDLSYKWEHTIKALDTPSDPDFQHVVEIDTLILEKLKKAGAIQPFSVARSDYLPFASRAVEIGGETYGVPHWTCGFFVMTTHPEVAAATSAVDLRDRLAALNTPAIDMGGDIIGKWESVISYLDAYHDTYPAKDPAEALDDTTTEPRTGTSLAAIGDACTTNGTSYCDVENDTMKDGLCRSRGGVRWRTLW
jgi:thiamine pyridinylase